jgi:hypothetical protein
VLCACYLGLDSLKPNFNRSLSTDQIREGVFLMRTSFVPIPALIAGAVFALLLSDAANAQTTTTPNPFSDGSKSQPPQTAQTRSAVPEKAAPVQQPAAGQFSSEAEAKSHCPGDTVVWANTGTKVYHYAGTAPYGKTKRGAFMCERETAAAGLRAARNEKRP